MSAAWQTVELEQSYAAGSEQDPHYLDLHEQGPPDRRSDEQKLRDDAASQAIWDAAAAQIAARRARRSTA